MSSDVSKVSRGAGGALRPVAIVTSLYLAAAMVGALVLGNQEFLLYIAVMLVMIAVILAVHRRVRLSGGVLRGLCLWGFLHMAGGLVSVPASWPTVEGSSVLYSWWIIPDRLKYDHVVHAFGFGLTTWLCWEGLRSFAPSVRPRLGPLSLCIAAGMGFGALNEVVEFAAVLLIPETNVGDYHNTGWDLVANLVGCLTAATLIRVRGVLPSH